MSVYTPLSLNNIFLEYGFDVIASNTFNIGSGTVTAPPDAQMAAVRIWGGGGGGGNGGEFNVGGGGGGGGFTFEALNVVPDSTVFQYEVGVGGLGNFGPGELDGTPGTTSNVVVNGITYSAFGGQGGIALGIGGAGGGGANGEIIISGATGENLGLGGAAGGVAIYGGGSGSSISPGSGGNGGQSFSDNGAPGKIIIDWLGVRLSDYKRSDGLIPNHSGNSLIPTTTTDLSVSKFNNTSLHFTATVTGDGGPDRGYRSGLYGSIDRDQFGISRTTLTQRTIVGVYETRNVFNDLFGNPLGYVYELLVEIQGDTREQTLGYRPVDAVSVNGIKQSLDPADFATATYNPLSDTTTYLSTQRIGSDSSWAFDNSLGAENDVIIFFNTPVMIRKYVSSNTYNSGSASAESGEPIVPPLGVNLAVAKLWGGGGGGTGGTGGGGGGFALLELPVIPDTTEFYYQVESGGNFSVSGFNGGNTKLSSSTNALNYVIAKGGGSNGIGGDYEIGIGAVTNLEWSPKVNENGAGNIDSDGGNAGGVNYGGGLGGLGAEGIAPGGGGASGFNGGGARLQIDWYAEVPFKIAY